MPGAASQRTPNAELVRAAQRELDRLNVRHQGRDVTVEPRGDDAMVVFHLRAGSRGGNLEVLLERTTLRVENVKVWR